MWHLFLLIYCIFSRGPCNYFFPLASLGNLHPSPQFYRFDVFIFIPFNSKGTNASSLQRLHFVITGAHFIGICIELFTDVPELSHKFL